MTLKELYDHYKRFAPEALDAEITLQVPPDEGMSLVDKEVDEHLFSVFNNKLYLAGEYDG